MSSQYVLRRLVQFVPAVLGIVLLGFVLVHAAPGDPVVALAGEDGDAEYYARMTERFGLDRPLVEQFTTYAGQVLQGNLGTSIAQGRPVAEVIAGRLPATLLLTSAALAVSTVGGIAVGTWMARRRGERSDLAANGALLSFHAAPDFWVAQVAIIVLAGGLGWFPVQGMSSARGGAEGVGKLLDLLHHLALPALVFGLSQMTVVARMTRKSLGDELGQLHVRAAMARGLPYGRVVRRHALRRALLPVATVIGGRIGHLLAGAVVIEVVFGWPGIGRLLLTAMQTRDHPLLLGLFLMIAFSVVVANLLTDLLYALLDPRIQYDQ